MSSVTFTAYTDDTAQIEAIQAFMKALKIRFDFQKEEKPYDPAFVEKIRQGDEDFKAGKGRKITVAELDKLRK